MRPSTEQAGDPGITDARRSVHRASFKAPIGEILLVADEWGLRELHLPGSFAREDATSASRPTNAALEQGLEQLEAYFAGELTQFDLPLTPEGTDFQLKVWRALKDIGFAKTESYGSVAARIGNPKASRAVGMANNKNPLAIVIPCHRVIGANGSLVGYGGGLWMKQWLLNHEAAVAGHNDAGRHLGPRPDRAALPSQATVS
ncbi:MAG: methylated-DNA--[protein]-cysteine S-methyltransferase [Acidimicrobiales bacterium]|jgi:methylated-DNA-[protein]-cysteine S-methyltransferase